MNDYLCTLHPIGLYAPNEILQQSRGNARQAIERELPYFAPLGDGVCAGEVAYFGFRYQAAYHLSRHKLGVLPCGRPLHINKVGLLYPTLKVKTWVLPAMWIHPHDVAAFVVALELWRPLYKEERGQVKPASRPTRFMPPPSAYDKRGGIVGSQKGVGLVAV